MPDLSLERFYCCQSAKDWQYVLKTEKGNYTIRWDNYSHRNKHNVEYDYSCTCLAYQFGRGKHCKHILEVKDKHCNWNQFIDGNLPRDHKCPRCNGEIESFLVGV